MKQNLSPPVIGIIALVVLLIMGGGMFYAWNHLGKEKGMTAAEAMEAGKREAAKGTMPKTPPPTAAEFLKARKGEQKDGGGKPRTKSPE